MSVLANRKMGDAAIRCAGNKAADFKREIDLFFQDCIIAAKAVKDCAGIVTAGHPALSLAIIAKTACLQNAVPAQFCQRAVKSGC